MFKPRAIHSLGSLAAALLLPLATRAESPGIAWRTNLDAAKIEAAQTHRLLLVHFWRPSCGPCRVLDQAVFVQPQVGSAVERSYVPVKVDTDASPALAGYFRIQQVPTDIVLDDQGNVVATLACPMTPDAYLGQIENVARSFRQSAGGAEAAPVNAAYASLPVSRTAPITPTTTPASAPTAGRYGQGAVPQQQTNPYIAGAPAPGQAQAVYPDQAPATPPGVAAGTAPTVAPQVAATSPAAVPPSVGLPTMPSNAMPRSYQASLAANQPPAAAAPAASVAQTQTQPAATVAPPVATQVAAAQPAASPQTVQLPPGCPPLAFDGCCPVTLKSYKKWATGNVAYGAVHRGRTYLFVGPRERDQFMANPDSYSPVFAGLDPVLLLDRQESAPGSRKFGYEFDGRFYLFSSHETMERFASNAQSYAAGVRQAMNRIDGAPGDVIRR